jgi:hypothetical protein
MPGSTLRSLCVCNVVQHFQGKLLVVAHGANICGHCAMRCTGGSFASELDGHSLLIDILKGCSCNSHKSSRDKSVHNTIDQTKLKPNTGTADVLLTRDNLQTGFSTASV